MEKHFVQKSHWAQFKNKYGTPAVEAAGVVFTKHAIPFTGKYYAYCPRVLPHDIKWKDLPKVLKKENCISINFDVPNVVCGSFEEKQACGIFDKYCSKTSKNTFAKGNVLMDLTKSEEDLFNNMHTKHRYNYRLAEKKGVYVKASDENSFEDFWKLFEETARRQKYFIRPRKYYEMVFDFYSQKDMCKILTAYFDKIPLASWMVFIDENILYYIYGGSSEDMQNLQASTFLGWEVIKYGKSRGCTLFDMWGAAYDPEDHTDEYHGFTTFKLRFGGKHIRYIDSYDFVLDKTLYALFNFANDLRWKILNATR